MNKVIYNKTTGVISGLSKDPRESSDVLTDMESPEIWDYVVENGVLVYSPQVAPPSNLEEAKTQKIAELNTKANIEYEAYLAKYPTLELKSFTIKAEEAVASQSGGATPYLDALTGGDATKKSVLITAILTKVAYSAQREASIVAVRDDIKACTAQTELDAIVIP